MNRTTPRLLSGLLVAIFIPSLCLGAATWEGVRVMPKSGNLQLMSSPEHGMQAGGVANVDWPAVVRKTDGQWLQISDEGGYSSAPLEGWVRKDDIVRLEEAQSHYTKKIQEAAARNASPRSQAEYYWLRGIYWENFGETASARADFEAALANPALAGDVNLRLARTVVQRSKSQALVPAQRTALFDRAEGYFKNSEAAFQRTAGKCPAEAYCSWGDALHERFCSGGAPDDAQRAIEKYKQAASAKPGWYVPLHGQGKVLLALGRGQKGDAETLLAAIDAFTQTIRVNPNCAEAYRERANALLALASTSGPFTADRDVPEAERTFSLAGASTASPTREQRLALLNEALDSAERAYLLGNNREPGSLETKARIEAAIAYVVYSDEPTLKGKPVPTDLKGSIDHARSLLARASSHASSAANYSQSLDEVDRRLALAVDCHSRSRQFASYLSPATVAVASAKKIKDASDQFAAVSEQAGQLEESLKREASDLHEPPVAAALTKHTTSVAQVKDNAKSAQKRLQEAVGKSGSERVAAVDELKGQLNKASEAYSRDRSELESQLSSESDPTRRKSLEIELEKHKQLSQALETAKANLEQAASETTEVSEIDSDVPKYTPLFLDR